MNTSLLKEKPRNGDQFKRWDHGKRKRNYWKGKRKKSL